MGRLRSVKAGPVEAELRSRHDDLGIGIPQVVEDLGSAAAERDRPVLLTVDEAHENLDVSCEIIRGVHGAGQSDHPVATYLAGLPGTHRGLAEITTYAERILVTELDLLDHDGVQVALVEPCRDLGVGVADLVVDEVAEHSGGYPYFVQIWGYHLWREATGDGIDLDTVERARTRVGDDIDRLFVSRWQRLTDRQRDYLVALAEVGGTTRSSNVAEDIGLDVTGASKIRAGLIDRGMIYAPARGNVAITIPGFASWVSSAQATE